MAQRRDEVLLPGERLVVAVRSHWVSVAEPVASTTLAFVVAIWVDSNVTRSSQAVGTIVWWLFLAVLARMLWMLLDWHHSWFVATDKRLLMRYGIITHKVAMMPLMKVTDMSYVRSIPGQLLGYGRFVLESAGQDQAMREVKWVPEPDETYRAICAEIFHITPPVGAVLDDDDLDLDDDPDDADPDDRGVRRDPDVHGQHGREEGVRDAAQQLGHPEGGAVAHDGDVAGCRAGRSDAVAAVEHARGRFVCVVLPAAARAVARRNFVEHMIRAFGASATDEPIVLGTRAGSGGGPLPQLDSAQRRVSTPVGVAWDRPPGFTAAEIAVGRRGDLIEDLVLEWGLSDTRLQWRGV